MSLLLLVVVVIVVAVKLPVLQEEDDGQHVAQDDLSADVTGCRWWW